MLDAKRLARVHRVRSLQLNLAQGEEARARAQVASETQLAARIAQLAGAVAPQADQAATSFSFAAAAHYRERLHRSAEAAGNRVRTAEAEADRSAAATLSARRDRSAIEKLLDRARIDATRAEMKAMRMRPPLQ